MSQRFPPRRVTREGSEISLKDTRTDKRPTFCVTSRPYWLAGDKRRVFYTVTAYSRQGNCGLIPQTLVWLPVRSPCTLWAAEPQTRVPQGFPSRGMEEEGRETGRPDWGERREASGHCPPGGAGRPASGSQQRQVQYGREVV